MCHEKKQHEQSSELESYRVATISDTPKVIPDRKKIKEEQDKDANMKIVKDWVKKGERPKIQTNRTPAALVSLWKQFNMLKLSNDGLLLRKWISKKEPEEEKSLIVVPDSLVEGIMDVHHSSLRTCHPGVDLSVDLCRREFYWPKMTEDFKEFIAACEKCSAIKQPRRYLRAPLQHLQFHNFNDCLIIDHIVPESIGRTARGFRYILTLTDAWSNYLVAVPVRTQTSKENIEQILRRWVMIFGIPKEIILDNHPGFSSEFFHSVCSYFDCKVTHGTSYLSRSTGKAERNNKRVNQALRAAIPPGQERSWDIYLGYCVMALNSLRNRHTGYSSNRLVFGRENNTPITLLIDNDLKTEVPSKKNKGAYEIYKNMKNTMRKVRENANTDFLYSKFQHDRNILGPFFKEGDLCFVLIECPAHKHSIRWRGPLQVKEVINDHLYVVQITNDTTKVVNISKMKHYVRNKYNEHKYPAKFSSNEQSLVTPSHYKPSLVSVKAPAVNENDSEDEEFITLSDPYKTKNSESNSSNSTPLVVIPRNVELENIQVDNSITTNLYNTEVQGNSSRRCSSSVISLESFDRLLGNDTSSSDEEVIQEPVIVNVEGRRLRDRRTIRPPDRFCP